MATEPVFLAIRRTRCRRATEKCGLIGRMVGEWLIGGQLAILDLRFAGCGVNRIGNHMGG